MNEKNKEDLHRKYYYEEGAVYTTYLCCSKSLRHAVSHDMKYGKLHYLETPGQQAVQNLNHRLN